MALRDWYNDDSNGKQSLHTSGQWWKTTYSYELNTSTCSEILGSKYSYLDTVAGIPEWQDKMKWKTAYWQTLEEALFEWVQRYEGARQTLTGEIIVLKANQFWERLPCYQGQPTPKWSAAWIDGFKRRHSLRQRNKHGEAGSADRLEHTREIIQEIREKAKTYIPEDVYNMDETGYFWKLVPDRSLGTERVSGQRQEKARITVALTCNATGSRKLPPWIIGKATHPKAFRAENIHGLEALGAHWRYNSTAWMTHTICMEYLKWFDRQMTGPTLLLMDNFSAHELAYLKYIGDEAKEMLKWTTVRWLPPNATSLHQPLDQGIIQNWKVHVRRRFVRFMVHELDRGGDPKTSMNVLRAVRWGIEAWEQDVTSTTIQNCWIRSQVYDWVEQLRQRIEPVTNGRILGQRSVRLLLISISWRSKAKLSKNR